MMAFALLPATSSMPRMSFMLMLASLTEAELFLFLYPESGQNVSAFCIEKHAIEACMAILHKLSAYTIHS
jgi:hypothetical protein